MFTPAEYCSPVWSRSAHTGQLDVSLNEAMRLISGCLRNTPINYLFFWMVQDLQHLGAQPPTVDYYATALSTTIYLLYIRPSPNRPIARGPLTMATCWEYVWYCPRYNNSRRSWTLLPWLLSHTTRASKCLGPTKPAKSWRWSFWCLLGKRGICCVILGLSVENN